jgi:hypothetical protein
MSQLTSITALRNSVAMQSRVENVMHFLKKQNPSWQADWYFPIAIINVSNDQADCTWVRDHSSTHHKGEGMLYSGGVSTEAQKVIANLKGFQARSEDDFVKLNELLTSAFGAPVNWINGFGVGTGAAVEQVPFSQSDSTASTPATGSPVASAKRVVRVKKSVSPTKMTKLDEAKKLFSDLTPKQKVDLVHWAERKIQSSVPCMQEREKLGLGA